MLGTRALQISMNAPVMTEVGNETGAQLVCPAGVSTQEAFLFVSGCTYTYTEHELGCACGFRKQCIPAACGLLSFDCPTTIPGCIVKRALRLRSVGCQACASSSLACGHPTRYSPCLDVYCRPSTVARRHARP